VCYTILIEKTEGNHEPHIKNVTKYVF